MNVEPKPEAVFWLKNYKRFPYHIQRSAGFTRCGVPIGGGTYSQVGKPENPEMVCRNCLKTKA